MNYRNTVVRQEAHDIVVSDQEEQLLGQTRSLLSRVSNHFHLVAERYRISGVVKSFSGTPSDKWAGWAKDSAALLTTLRETIEAPISVMICGEFNSGKSSIINALAGEAVAEVGILPTTVAIDTHITSSLVFVDSPGTNSIFTSHQSRTESYLRQVDFVVFVTSAERPLSESERRFLKMVHEHWRKKVLVLVNKVDLLGDRSARSEVSLFIQRGLSEYGFNDISVHLVSARTGEGIQEFIALLRRRFDAQGGVSVKIASRLSAAQVVLETGCAHYHDQLTRCSDILEDMESHLRRMEEHTAQLEKYLSGLQTQVISLFEEVSVRLYRLCRRECSVLNSLKERIRRRQNGLTLAARELFDTMRFDERLQSESARAAQQLEWYQRVASHELSSLSKCMPKDMLAVKPLTFSYSPNSGSTTMDHTLRSKESSTLIHKIIEVIEDAGQGSSRVIAVAAVGCGFVAAVTSVAPLEVAGLCGMGMFGVGAYQLHARTQRRVQARIAECCQEVRQAHIASVVEPIKEFITLQRQTTEGLLTPKQVALQEHRERCGDMHEDASSLLRQVIELGSQ